MVELLKDKISECPLCKANAPVKSSDQTIRVLSIDGKPVSGVHFRLTAAMASVLHAIKKDKK